MTRRAVPILAMLAMLAAAEIARAEVPVEEAKPAPALAPAAKIEPPDATELARQGDDLWHLKQDYNGALVKFNQAVDAAPNAIAVRLKRAQFFEIVSGMVIANEKQTFKDLAHDDYVRIAHDEPDSIRGGIARDGLTRLSGKTLIEEQTVPCPPAAVQAHNRGESLFGAHRFSEAAVEYEKATTACPASATLWVDLADANFLMEDYEKAKAYFVKALAIDPWNRSGHRFLADTEARLNERDAVFHELELAVISDPVYEAGWSALRTYAAGIGRQWNRVYGSKTVVTRGPDTKGKQNINIAVPTGEAAEAKDAEGMLWMGYGITKASVFSGSTFDSDASGKAVERKLDPDKMSALEIESESVKSALQMAREAETKTGDKPGPFWSMMMRAQQAGFLDEAIFLHMLDAPLAAEYPAFRDKNAARLVAYLDTMIIPAAENSPRP